MEQNRKMSYLNRFSVWVFENSNILMTISIVAFFLLELGNRVYFFLLPEESLSISFYPKMLLQIFFILPVISRYNVLPIAGKVLIWFSFALVILGLFRFADNMHLFIGGMKHYNKALLSFFVYFYLTISKPLSQRIYKVFDSILIVNAILITIGLLTGFEYLKSYPFSERFGYSGVFSRYAINDLSLFYLIGNFYMYARWKRQEVKTLFFGLVFLSSFLVGTKAIYLQNLILIAYVFFSDKKSRFFVISSALVSIAVLLFVYNFSMWENIFQSKGILAVLSSLRTELLMDRIPRAFLDGTLIDLLVGFRYPFWYYVEMDIIDMILTFGIIGTGIFSFLYVKVLFWPSLNQVGLITVFAFTFILLASISGRYTYSGMNAVYLPLFLYYIRNVIEKRELLDETVPNYN